MAVDPRDQAFAGRARAILALGGLLGLLFMGAVAYWTTFREDLGENEDNPRLLRDFSDPGRGRILDREGSVVAESLPTGERVYHNTSLAHVLGYLSARYGTQGVELAFNAELAGEDAGTSFQDAIDAEFRRSKRQGSDVVLTIDPVLQLTAAQALGDRNGAVVAIDPRNGEILAMVSYPTYDPSTLEENGEALLADDSAPLVNRATQGLYPPGSTFKTVTAISLLEHDVIKPEDRVTCPGEIVIDGFPISCNNVPQGTGTYPFRNAFVFSVNAIFGEQGDKLGWSALLDTARKLGFDSALDFTLETARTQVFGDGSELTRPLLASTAFGQGELLATPLQMAVVAAAVANDGVIVQPHLGLEVRSPEGGSRPLEGQGSRRVFSPETARIMKEFMVGVVDNQQANGVAIPGVKVGGKTGTAESGTGTSHAWFIAFAPADNPTIAVAVVVENGGQGGVVASPIAGSVIRARLNQ